MKLPIFIRARWKWVKRQPFEKWAALLTSFYLSLFLLILLARWSELFGLPLNELGDFAAGVFAPLAFLWLVLGYKQQGNELRQGTEALRLQAAELRSSVEQQSLLVDAQNVSHTVNLRTLQPLLQISFNDDYQTFLIKNMGQYCESISVRQVVDDALVEGVNVEPLFHGMSHAFGLYDTHSFDEFNLVVDYTMLSGSRCHQLFKVEVIMEEARVVGYRFHKRPFLHSENKASEWDSASTEN
ncbi:hypothetical protein ACBQ21_08900 [Pseudomonas putida]|uniref:hypothetical protein n=1 Tax=Pseudomonas putida TaxID=303 RepID=UPI003524D3D4